MEARQPTKTQWTFLLVAHIVQWRKRSSLLNVLCFTSARHQQKAGLEMLLLQGEITSVCNI